MGPQSPESHISNASYCPSHSSFFRIRLSTIFVIGNCLARAEAGTDRFPRGRGAASGVFFGKASMSFLRNLAKSFLRVWTILFRVKLANDCEISPGSREVQRLSQPI